jgi:hypothetical protein
MSKPLNGGKSFPFSLRDIGVLLSFASSWMFLQSRLNSLVRIQSSI